MIDLPALRGALTPYRPAPLGEGHEYAIEQRKQALLALRWPILANAWEAEARRIIAENEETP